MLFKNIASASMLAGLVITLPTTTFAVPQNSGQFIHPPQQRQSPPPQRQPQRNNPPPQRTNPQPRSAPPQRNEPGPAVHAPREIVRTPNFVPRHEDAPRQAADPVSVQAPNHQTDRRRVTPTSPVIVNQRSFTHTAAGRVYDNGLILHHGVNVSQSWQKPYFPKGKVHFNGYRQSFIRGSSYISPFGFYFGVCVPFISADQCRIFPPSVVFIDVPVFNGVVFTTFADAADQNLLNDPSLDQEQPGLLNAIDALTETFQGGNIEGLVSLIDPNTSIAIYLNGHYQYSLTSNDYVDLTRDAILSMHTVNFTLNYLHQRAPGVFSVAGKQTYRDQNNQIQTTYVSYVLQDISGNWTLTQVGNAPAKKRKF